ncbi:hypothetical protein RhiirA4_450409 [Rhizophagus irregularis]|uniref:Uncharacterized protein n=1 Tax=Rhizophagus irregularis TaxID=588596 RepID=A0A2I1FT76_9GLOM|nr:hypothetical protein RhiirA4_450409 [Rhizophagus irregularis]
MSLSNKNKNKNKTGNDTTTKRPASSSPAGNVSGQGFSPASPSNTLPLTTSANKRTRVSEESSAMNIEQPLPPSPGLVETTSVKEPSQPEPSSLDTSLHTPTSNHSTGKGPKITPAVSFPERAASPDAFQAAVQFQPILYYASAALNDIEGF